MTSVGCSSFSEMTVVVPSGLRRTLRTILFTTRFFRLPVSASTMTSPMEFDASTPLGSMPSYRALAASSFAAALRSRVHPPPEVPMCSTASSRPAVPSTSRLRSASPSIRWCTAGAPRVWWGNDASSPCEEKTLKATRNAARKASAGRRRPAIVRVRGAPRKVSRISRNGAPAKSVNLNETYTSPNYLRCGV